IPAPEATVGEGKGDPLNRRGSDSEKSTTTRRGDTVCFPVPSGGCIPSGREGSSQGSSKKHFVVDGPRHGGADRPLFRVGPNICRIYQPLRFFERVTFRRFS